MSVTKADVYKWIAEAHRDTGQGLTGIVKLGNFPEVGGLIEELMEEGVVEEYDSGPSSIGHRESNRWYFIKGYYNVFTDSDEQDRRSLAGFLNHIRLYLGCLEEDENRGETAKAINPTANMLVQSAAFMKDYAEWLERNEEALEKMKTIDEIYVGEGIKFTPEEREWLTTRDWYKENETVSDSLESSKKGKETRLEKISITEKLIDLLSQRGSDEDKKDIENHKAEIEETKVELGYRKKAERWLAEQDKDAKIQDCEILDVEETVKEVE